MPREQRLLGYAVGSRMTQQQAVNQQGQGEVDDNGMPVMTQILELILIDQQFGDVVIIPLTREGVENVKKALNPSGLIVPTPGAVPPLLPK